MQTPTLSNWSWDWETVVEVEETIKPSIRCCRHDFFFCMLLFENFRWAICVHLFLNVNFFCLFSVRIHKSSLSCCENNFLSWSLFPHGFWTHVLSNLLRSLQVWHPRGRGPRLWKKLTVSFGESKPSCSVVSATWIEVSANPPPCEAVRRSLGSRYLNFWCSAFLITHALFCECFLTRFWQENLRGRNLRRLLEWNLWFGDVHVL